MKGWSGALSAAASVLALGGPVSAARFNVDIANWFVYSMTNSSIAGNRPPAEYNFSPWNSLTLHAARDGSYRVEVMFWPGLFKQGHPYQLSLQPEGRNRHVVDAEAIGSHGLKTVQPVGDDFVGDLRGSKLLLVSATDTPDTLGFDISHGADVVEALEDCRRTLGG